MADRPLPFGSDDELLAALGAALAPEQVRPSPGALHEVRLLLTQRNSTGFRRRLAGQLSDWRWQHRGWRARLAVAGATIGLVAVGSGTAFALGASVPAPVRSLAYDLGLPVTPPAVVQVQDAAHAVQSDLVATSGTDQTDTVRDTRALAHDLFGLSPGERLSVQWSERVFAQACRAIASYRSTSSTWPTAASPVPACAQSSSPTGARSGFPGGAGGTPSGGRNPEPGSGSSIPSNGRNPSGHGQSPPSSGPGSGQPAGGAGGPPGSGPAGGGDPGHGGGGQLGGGSPGGTTEGMRR